MPSSSRLPSSAKFSTSGIPFNSASISCPSPGSKLSGMSSASTKTIMITLPGLKTTTSWAGFKLRILAYARSTLFLNTSSIALFLAFKLLMLKPFMVMLTSVFFPGQLLMVIGPRLVFLQGAATGGGGATTPPVLHATSNLIPHPLSALSVRLAQTWAPLVVISNVSRAPWLLMRFPRFPASTSHVTGSDTETHLLFEPLRSMSTFITCGGGTSSHSTSKRMPQPLPLSVRLAQTCAPLAEIANVSRAPWLLRRLPRSPAFAAQETGTWVATHLLFPALLSMSTRTFDGGATSVHEISKCMPHPLPESVRRAQTLSP